MIVWLGGRDDSLSSLLASTVIGTAHNDLSKFLQKADGRPLGPPVAEELGVCEN
jgi:hypothetical protein